MWIHMKKIVIFIILISFFSGIIMVFTDSCFCREYRFNNLYVGGNGFGNYSKIQDAINNASDGVKIFVYKGNYDENISINKSISLIGKNRKYTKILNCIEIKANNTLLSGFTVKGSSNKSKNNEELIAIKIFGFNNCKIKDNVLSNKNYGIYIKNSSNNIINDNYISNNSYGVFLSNNCKNNLFYHNNFFNNSLNSYDKENNTWFNVSLKQGNYWDDYEGSDKNNDGIGDIYYNISGGENKDKFPLVMPYYGKVVIKEFYVNNEQLYQMLFIGLIAAILFCLPIAYYLYRKYRKEK